MKANKGYRLIGLLIGVLISLTLVNADGDFDISPDFYDISKDVNVNHTFPITINNTGNESLNFTISKIDLVNGSDVIELNLSNTTIVNLTQGNVTQINVSYNSGSVEGVFNGQVNIDGVVKEMNISIQLTVVDSGDNNGTNDDEPSLSFEDEGSTLEINAELGEEEREYFTIINDGDEILEDITIDIDDLEGRDDEIRVNDIEIDRDDVDEFEISRLNPEDTQQIRILVDVDDDIDVDYYSGDLTISAQRPNGDTYERTFTLRVVTESDEGDVYIEPYSGDVRDSELILFGEQDEIIDNYEIVIRNDGKGRVNDLRLQLDDDLEAINSGNTISKSDVHFFPNSVDIDDRDIEEIEVEVDIPDNQATGEYLADVELISSSGKKLDTILLRVKVVGDIYISEIISDDSVTVGNTHEVKVKVKNQGNKIYRNIKVTGTLFSVDFGNSDIVESSSSFILDSGSERDVNLRFSIPKDAQDKNAVLEIKVNYDGEEFYELEDVNIERPINNVVIDSFTVNPRVAKCDDNIYTYIKFRNLGKYDRNVQVAAEIVDTNIKKTSSNYNLRVDEIKQENMNLDISNLEAGDYTLVQRVTYNGLLIQESTDITILECNEGSTDIDFEPINDTQTNETIDDKIDDDKILLFGNPVDKIKVYLGSGIVFVTALIVIGLFLI